MTDHTITITKVDGLEPVWFVEAKLSNGFETMAMRCASEDEARVYVRGLEDGFSLVRNAIGRGLFFNGRITELEPTGDHSVGPL